jgi:hypothetical protein
MATATHEGLILVSSADITQPFNTFSWGKRLAEVGVVPNYLFSQPDKSMMYQLGIDRNLSPYEVRYTVNSFEIGFAVDTLMYPIVTLSPQQLGHEVVSEAESRRTFTDDLSNYLTFCEKIPWLMYSHEKQHILGWWRNALSLFHKASEGPNPQQLEIPLGIIPIQSSDKFYKTGSVVIDKGTRTLSCRELDDSTPWKPFIHNKGEDIAWTRIDNRSGGLGHSFLMYLGEWQEEEHEELRSLLFELRQAALGTHYEDLIPEIVSIDSQLALMHRSSYVEVHEFRELVKKNSDLLRMVYDCWNSGCSFADEFNKTLKTTV